MDMIMPALVATAARHGIALEVIQPSYDQVAQEALSPDSKVNSSKPDAVFFALDYRALPLKLSLADVQTASNRAGRDRLLADASHGINANSNAVCIFQTFAPPAETLFGSLDRALPEPCETSLTESIASLPVCSGSGDVLLDVAGLGGDGRARQLARSEVWNMAKFPFPTR